MLQHPISWKRATVTVGAGAALLVACSNGNPLGPSTPPPTVATPAPAVCAPGQRASAASRILVAGQSNAIFLLPSLPDAIDCTFVGGSVEFYRTNANFAEYGRATDLTALVWWQGAADTNTPRGDYVQRLRDVIGIARAGNPTLPVRVVEIPDTPDRATVRDAQREVARDPGVELIPTADLPLDATGHFVPAGYVAVRDRLYRSLGR